MCLCANVHVGSMFSNANWARLPTLQTVKCEIDEGNSKCRNYLKLGAPACPGRGIAKQKTKKDAYQGEGLERWRVRTKFEKRILDKKSQERAAYWVDRPKKGVS